MAVPTTFSVFGEFVTIGLFLASQRSITGPHTPGVMPTSIDMGGQEPSIQSSSNHSPPPTKTSRLFVECEPFIRMGTTVISLTWIEVYLENGKTVNIDADGKSL